MEQEAVGFSDVSDGGRTLVKVLSGRGSESDEAIEAHFEGKGAGGLKKELTEGSCLFSQGAICQGVW
jgi:hypothetical protein